MRRIGALLVAVVLISGALPGTALADDPPANVPPVAVDDPGEACGNDATGGSFPIPEDWGDWFLLFGPCSLLYNDTDEDGDSLTWELLDAPAHGEVIDVPDLGFAYRPEPDWSTLPGDVPGGDWVSDSFTYRAFDGTDYSEPATMRFWIAPVNDPPTFTPGPELVEVDEDSGPYSAVWATDVSPGPSNESYQTVTFEILSVEPDDLGLFAVPPSIDADGVLTFTPAADRFGLAWVTYRLVDDGGLEDYGLSPRPEFTPPRNATDEAVFAIVVYPVLDGDTAPPVIDALTQSIPNQTVGASTVKLKLAWTGSDPGSGIAAYQLQLSRNGGPWKTLPAPSASATSTTRTVAPGSSYRYRIRATDVMGNRSAYVSWPALTPTLYQEGTSRLAWTRSWSTSVNSKLSGGRARYSSAASRKVVLTFTGRDVAWVTARRPSSGRAEVRVDGVLVATVDLRASSTLYRRTIFRHHFPTRAAHTLEIRPLGDGRIDIDAFLVLR